MEPSNEAEIASSTQLPAVGYDVLTPIVNAIFGGGGSGGGASGLFETIVNILTGLWTFYAFLAYAFVFFLLYLYVYASIEKAKLSEIQAERIKVHEEAFKMQSGEGARQDRFKELQDHVNSSNPNDWKLAIIEADIILDDLLKKQGYAGASLGERLRGMSPGNLASLDDAWQAHKVRNQIAHEGADFVLTQRVAAETIVRYERVFRELGAM